MGDGLYGEQETMQTGDHVIHISIPDQWLTVRRGEKIVVGFPVSTSRYGLGVEEGSMKTPTGLFRIAEKLGDGVAIGTVFRSRLPLELSEVPAAEDEDLILTRILWLAGLEEHNANTYDRYIYIHGTNQEALIGQTASHGCVRMRGEDLVQVFDLVDVDTPVVIRA